MGRDTLFISHATPEDNEFSIWLASRLEMLGYKTWVDKKQLLGGERMWQEIQTILENNTIKFLLVYSKNVRDINNKVRSGIYDELSFANSISRKENLKDFIIPLHIDDSSYSEIIGLDGIRQLQFSNSWADGLKELINKLEIQKVKKTEIKTLSISSWYENEYLDCCKIEKKEEVYYSTWWKISQHPDNFYIHIFKNKQQADLIKQNINNIPIGQISNNIVTFEPNLQITVKDGMFTHVIKTDNVIKCSMNDIIHGVSSIVFPTSSDIIIYFTYLLNQTFFKLMKSKRLRHYRLSKNLAFYLGSFKKFNFINFFYPNTEIKKSKKIGGKYHDNCWNYAISSKAILEPFFGYSLSSHIIFTKDGINPVEDDKFQSSHRRSKARMFFNPEWRDLLLAFIHFLRDEDNEIKIVVNNNGNFVKLELWPEIYTTDFGYDDSLVKNENIKNEYGDDE